MKKRRSLPPVEFGVRERERRGGRGGGRPDVGWE